MKLLTTRARPPKVALRDLEEILAEVAITLRDLPDEPRTTELRIRSSQCFAAIEMCRRVGFSNVLRRALSAKVLAVETDALILRRVLRRRAN